jgi:hypothetical protein
LGSLLISVLSLVLLKLEVSLGVRSAETHAWAENDRARVIASLDEVVDPGITPRTFADDQVGGGDAAVNADEIAHHRVRVNPVARRSGVDACSAGSAQAVALTHVVHDPATGAKVDPIDGIGTGGAPADRAAAGRRNPVLSVAARCSTIDRAAFADLNPALVGTGRAVADRAATAGLETITGIALGRAVFHQTAVEDENTNAGIGSGCAADDRGIIAG